jgi:23S rRNA A2030 N6-methylase RlmJ
VRNKWAHQHPFSTDDTYRALDTSEHLLNAVSSTEQAVKVRKMKQDLLRLSQEEQARNIVRKTATSALNNATPSKRITLYQGAPLMLTSALPNP